MDKVNRQVLSIIADIPYGKVASYGQIARILGEPKQARKVGRIVAHAYVFGNFPCHRVVYHDGSLVSHWVEQRDLLEKEGIVFTSHDKIDMRIYQWDR